MCNVSLETEAMPYTMLLGKLKLILLLASYIALVPI